jgi:hypothetical protein
MELIFDCAKKSKKRRNNFHLSEDLLFMVIYNYMFVIKYQYKYSYISFDAKKKLFPLNVGRPFVRRNRFLIKSLDFVGIK